MHDVQVVSLSKKCESEEKCAKKKEKPRDAHACQQVHMHDVQVISLSSQDMKRKVYS